MIHLGPIAIPRYSVHSNYDFFKLNRLSSTTQVQYNVDILKHFGALNPKKDYVKSGKG